MYPGGEKSRLNALKANLERRAQIYSCIREFFRERGFLEIETPLRVPQVAPELNIFPFQSDGWELSTSPEIHMKRLLAAGYERIFQMCHCFRKDEQGRWHNSEFTMLEWYRTNSDYQWMMDDTEQLFFFVAQKLGMGEKVRYQNFEIDLTPPWQRITVRDAFLKWAGWDPVTNLDAERFDIDLVTKVIPGFPVSRPVVLLDYPSALGSLARLKPGQPEVAERAEFFVGGLEIANAYSELTDKNEQERRFQHEITQIEKEQKRKAAIPPGFLEALGYLPPCSGNALGIDRLVMLFCNAGSLEEVVPFTTKTA